MAVYKRGKKWWIDFEWKGQHLQRPTHARTKTEARRELEEWKYQVKSGKAAQESRMLFRELGEKYLSEYAVTKRSYRRDVVLVRNLAGFFGDYHLVDITPELILRYRTRRSKQMAFSSTNRELSCLRKMLNLGVDWNLLTVNPTRRVKPLLLPEENIRERILTPEEERKLIESCAPSYLRDVVLLILHSGLRIGEVLSLRWQNVLFPLNQIVIEATNSKSRRVRRIPMNSVARAVLSRLQDASGSDYVFADGEGKPFQYVRVAKSFQRACRKAGIGGLRLHDLRHNFATKLSSRNVPLTTIQKLLGHSTITMTQRYAHAQYEQEAVDLLVEQNPLEVPTVFPTVAQAEERRMAVSS